MLLLSTTDLLRCLHNRSAGFKRAFIRAVAPCCHKFISARNKTMWPCHVKPLCMAKHACLHCPMHHRIAASESQNCASWSSWLCLGLCGRLLHYHDRLSHCKILNFVIDCRSASVQLQLVLASYSAQCMGSFIYGKTSSWALLLQLNQPKTQNRSYQGLQAASSHSCT